MLNNNPYTYLFDSAEIEKLASAQSFRSWAEWRLKPQSQPFSFDASTLLDEQFIIPVVEPRPETSLKTLLDKQEARFLEELMAADFAAEVDNYCIRIVEKYTTKSKKEEFICWLGEFYTNHQQQDEVVIQLLGLFGCFSYEDLQPLNNVIAAACVHHRSLYVQSAALSLLGNWCNKEALEILNTYEEPTNPWVKMKYDGIKEVITNVLRP